MKLCPGVPRLKFVDNKVPIAYKYYEGQGAFGMDGLRFKDGLRRRKETCPYCGRRIVPSYIIDNDADFIMFSIPPHKPKVWWKKAKKKSKQNRQQIRRHR